MKLISFQKAELARNVRVCVRVCLCCACLMRFFNELAHSWWDIAVSGYSRPFLRASE